MAANKTIGSGAVPRFGAALSALAVTPLAHAAIVPLTVPSGPVSVATAPFSFDLIDGGPPDIGVNTGAGVLFAVGNLGGGGLKPSTESSTVYFNSSPVFSNVPLNATTGDQFFAFQSATDVGWIKLRVISPTEVEFLAAAIEDSGGPIHVGTGATVVPLPAALPMFMSALGMLALGAAGVRKHRERRAAGDPPPS